MIQVQILVEWLLVIAFTADDLGPVRIPFETRAECMAAAESFVAENPIFEWLDRPGAGWEAEQLVLRPTIRCTSSFLVGPTEF